MNKCVFGVEVFINISDNYCTRYVSLYLTSRSPQAGKSKYINNGEQKNQNVRIKIKVLLKLFINSDLPPNPYSEGVKVLLKLSINNNLLPDPYSEGGCQSSAKTIY